jgi:hypothetical protein
MACPVTTNETLSGSIASTSERDYYVFYVAHQTDLAVTVTDTEDPRCTESDPSYPYFCGSVKFMLLDSRGNALADSNGSAPVNGVPVPVSTTTTIGRGIYYVAVSGFVDTTTLPAIPYQLTVDGNPGVQWPPACIVPRLHSNRRLGHIEHVVRNHRCTVGAVHYVRSPGTPRGHVVRLSPGSGSILPYGAPVTIFVAGHPRHHHRHRHRHHH